MNKKIILAGFCTFLLGIQSMATFADTEVNLNDSTSVSGFTVKNASSDAVISARGDGNVGVGTNSPAQTLHIKSSDGTSGGGTASRRFIYHSLVYVFK